MKKYKVSAIVEAEDKQDALYKVRNKLVEVKVKRIKPVGVLSHEDYPMARQWMDAGEAHEKMDDDTKVWAWSKNDDVVRKWHCAGDGYWYTPQLGLDGYMPRSWDMKHQPTHVMPRTEGEEPPAPPVIEPEPTLYQKVKAICEDKSKSFYTKQALIYIHHPIIWEKAYMKMVSLISGYSIPMTEAQAYIVCCWTIRMAKEQSEAADRHQTVESDELRK